MTRAGGLRGTIITAIVTDRPVPVTKQLDFP